MATCPSCGYDNITDAIVCVKCSLPLVPKSTRLVQTTLEIPDNIVSARRYFPKQTGTLGGTSMSLFIEEGTEPLILEVVRQAILGRYEANNRSQPRVDLTPFGAYEKGVSRLHAIIRRTDHGLMIEDLASTNGTA